MHGTDKQIVQATKIRDNVINTLTTAMPIIMQSAPSPFAAKMAGRLIQTRIDALNSPNVCAGDIIKLFESIHFTGDIECDFGHIQTAYSVAVAQTESQKILLG